MIFLFDVVFMPAEPVAHRFPRFSDVQELALLAVNGIDDACRLAVATRGCFYR